MPERLEVEVRAEVAKLRSDLSQAKGQISNFGKEAKKTFSELGKAVIAAFAIGKITSFVKTGITEFAKFDRSLTLITDKVTRAGQSFDGLRGSVEDYIRTTEAATRFSKFELAETLDLLIAKTGDFNTALALNEKAMDLAVLGNISLKTAGDALALAVEGNTTGVSQLARVLGMSTLEAKDTAMVFAELESVSKGMARTEAGLAVQIDQLNNSLNDAAEVLGEELGPTIVWLSQSAMPFMTEAMSRAVKVGQTFGTLWSVNVLLVKNTVMAIMGHFRNLATFMRDVWTGPIEAFKNFVEREKRTILEFRDAQVRDVGLATEEFEAIWIQSAASKKKLDAQSARDSFTIKRKEVRDTKQTEKEKQDAIIETAEVRKTQQEQLLIFLEEASAAEVAQFEISVEAIKNLATSLSNAIGDSMALFVTEVADGAMTVGEAFKKMGQEMFRSIVTAIGEGLLAEGAAYIARGVAALLSVVGSAAAPGYFAAGAQLSAIGGVIKGLALALAEGGIVTEPTFAMVGEAGPEAVIPLEKGMPTAGLGGGVDMSGSTIHFNFPGIRNAREVSTPRFAQSVERQLAEQLQKLNMRKGVKLGT